MEVLMWVGVAIAALIAGGASAKLARFFLDAPSRYELITFVPYMTAALFTVLSTLVFIGAIVAAIVAATN